MNTLRPVQSKKRSKNAYNNIDDMPYSLRNVDSLKDIVFSDIGVGPMASLD